jgi:hypothetical protein
MKLELKSAENFGAVGTAGWCIRKGIVLLPCYVTCETALCLCRHHSTAKHIKLPAVNDAGNLKYILMSQVSVKLNCMLFSQ